MFNCAPSFNEEVILDAQCWIPDKIEKLKDTRCLIFVVVFFAIDFNQWSAMIIYVLMGFILLFWCGLKNEDF